MPFRMASPYSCFGAKIGKIYDMVEIVANTNAKAELQTLNSNLLFLFKPAKKEQCN